MSKSKSLVKIDVFIQEDPSFAAAGLGKRYQIQKMVFDRKTGRTLEIASYGTGYPFKEACQVKGRILNDYFG